MLILKHLLNWSYNELEYEVRANSGRRRRDHRLMLLGRQIQDRDTAEARRGASLRIQKTPVILYRCRRYSRQAPHDRLRACGIREAPGTRR